MADEARFGSVERLRPVVRAAFGAGARLLDLERLTGGSKKGAYRLNVLEAGRRVPTTALAYVWGESEDYWQGVLPESATDPAEPFSHASGLDLFEAAANRLTAVGVRCPRILLADRSRALYPVDVAVVEYVPGGSLQRRLEQDPTAADRALDVLADWLETMGAHRAPHFGKVAFVDGGGVPGGTSCSQVVLDRALAEVAEVSGRDARFAADRARLEELLHRLAARIGPRGSSALVHGELGPDHVLLDTAGEPVLIDIEGLMYFDVEWEYVFLRMRFPEQYARLARTPLDEDRMRLYRLAQHIDLVAGPLRIADTGHPEREWFRGVAEYHLQRTLAYPG